GVKPFILPVVTPGADPLAALAAAVKPVSASAGSGTEPPSSVVALSPEQFRVAVERRAEGRPAVLLVDQFEEVFTLCDSEEVREKFAGAVVGLIGKAGQASPTHHRVILTVREDYLGQALQLAALKPLAADPEARFIPPAMSSR